MNRDGRRRLLVAGAAAPLLLLVRPGGAGAPAPDAANTQFNTEGDMTHRHHQT